LLLKELKNAGITHKMDTPKPGKKPAFSTPGGASSAANAAGRVFGRTLSELSQLLVALDADTDILVPKFVVGACSFIQVVKTFSNFFAARDIKLLGSIVWNYDLLPKFVVGACSFFQEEKVFC
jgi:hypothetical protein